MEIAQLLDRYGTIDIRTKDATVQLNLNARSKWMISQLITVKRDHGGELRKTKFGTYWWYMKDAPAVALLQKCWRHMSHKRKQARHAIRLWKDAQPPVAPKARLNEEIVIQLRETFRDIPVGQRGDAYARYAAQYGVTPSTISQAVLGRTWGTFYSAEMLDDSYLICYTVHNLAKGGHT